MKVLSLFDGISCARVALERAGIPVEAYYASEIDKYAIQVSQNNYPDIVHIGDVKRLKLWNDNPTAVDFYYREGVVDLLIGGSPCQDLSIAKANRKGLDGERSGLFWEYVRILNEVKPKYFILENVASMSKDAKQAITDALYRIEPVMINAALVSAQNRKRLFWVGALCADGTYKQVEIAQPDDKGILLRDILEPKVDESFYVKDKSNTIRTSGRGSGIDDRHNWDTIRIGQFNSGGQGDRIYSQDGKSVCLSAQGGGRGAKTGLYMIQRPHGYNKGGVFTEKCPTLTKSSFEQNNHVTDSETIRKLTPTECERLQGLPDGYTEGISNTQRYKALGNAFNVDVVAHIIKHLI